MFTFNFATELSGSITRLSDGTSYLIAGQGLSILSQSNGSILISLSGSAGGGGVDNVNVSGSYLSFYDATPVPQHAGISQVDYLGSARNTSNLSSDCNSNFNDLFSKVNEIASKVNEVREVLSETLGGIGITE